MDDIAREIAERNARNEYLVGNALGKYYPMHLHPGKQEPTVTIEVRVRWQRVDGKNYWRRPHVIKVTIAEFRNRPDALWNLLTRCLPFEEWKYVDWGPGLFHQKWYSQDADDEPLSDFEISCQEYWFESFGYDTIRPWGNDKSERPDKETAMNKVKMELSEAVFEANGIIDQTERYGIGRSENLWWFALNAVDDGAPSRM
jgi:hypothetical protein